MSDNVSGVTAAAADHSHLPRWRYIFRRTMNPKQRAAEAALPFLRNGMVIGLGTGSTADFFLQALAAALQSGRLSNITGVPTSRQSEHRALELGIPLTTLMRAPV